MDVTCRICGGRHVELFLDLGDQPHCNRLIPPARAAEREPHYPLRTGFCHDCTLVQIDHTIPKENMFSDYPYVSGTTKTLVQHFKDTSERLIQTYELKAGDLVVDIGSNDGSWIAQYQPFGLKVLGVEAAENVATMALEQGRPTINRFFNEETAQHILDTEGGAALVTAAGVFFHLEELHSVVRGIHKLIGEDGVFVVQAIYLGGMIENLAFDQIYHEHLCYYTLRSLERLFLIHGLEAFDARVVPIHGGSIEVHAARVGRRKATPALAEFRAMETAKGYGELSTYQRFATRVWDLKRRLVGLLEEWRTAGKSVWAYGAPAKGATLLNSFGIGPDLVQQAVEKNPMKIGFAMPGSRIPIMAEGATRPDGYLVLAWNFLPEFLEKERAYLEQGGALITPVPKVEVITRDSAR
ncbi:MAG TPA: class I SAM-dependent methyltransferase [Stellaceae bacterium]|nr:class I SAM-dependent methyltransferase [Stellaceae bacterium]